MIEIIRMDPKIINLPEGAAAGRLGFKGRMDIPDEFRDLYGTSMDRIRETADPMALIGEFNAGSDPPRIEDQEIPGNLAEKHLGGSDTVSILLVTIGSGIDDLIDSEERGGNTLSSFFLDGLASELVEFAVRKLDSDLRKKFQNRSGGARISPGYGDLPLELNEWILNILSGSRIGVSCVETSYQLVPRKTVAALIGWRDRVEE
ncbi:MAG: methionine synthase [Thermoplasmatota archaeon]